MAQNRNDPESDHNRQITPERPYANGGGLYAFLHRVNVLDYVHLCKTARTNPRPFKVEYLYYNFFEDIENPLSYYQSIRPRKLVGDPKVTDLNATKFSPEVKLNINCATLLIGNYYHNDRNYHDHVCSKICQPYIHRQGGSKLRNLNIFKF
ncbi:hypothetical protein JTB14_027254 [Gonioctena quinquepunctata]|nr:hypothetical protein JTB14_027254 [Gonioctena quinquepunctata]